MEFILKGDTEHPRIDYFDPDDRSQDGRLYKFTVYVSSIEMADEIIADFHYFVNGFEDHIALEVNELTVRKYLDSILQEDVSGELWNLAYAIMNYGYYAQQYLSVNAKTPWVIGEDHREIPHVENAQNYTQNELNSYKPEIGVQADDVEGLSISLTLDTDTAINIYVKTASGYSGEITACDLWGEVEYNVEKVSDGRYKITIPGIAAHQLGDMNHVIITTDEGNTVIYYLSALSFAYLSSVEGKPAKDVASALYDYFWAARAYQESLADQG
jgi:hypothetical protein